MADDPFAQLLATWRQATDTYIGTWSKMTEAMQALPGSAEVTQEAGKTSLGVQAAAREISRQAFEPMVELAGGVPLGEFRRLMDHVHGIHLRLDKIEDMLREQAKNETKRKRKAKS